MVALVSFCFFYFLLSFRFFAITITSIAPFFFFFFFLTPFLLYTLHSIGLWARCTCSIYALFLTFRRIAFSCAYCLRNSRVSVVIIVCFAATHAPCCRI